MKKSKKHIINKNNFINKNKTKPNEDNQYTSESKIKKITWLGIILLITVIGFVAINAFNGHFNPIHPYLGDHIFSGGFVSQQNPDFPSELDMQIILKSTSLSAQNPIEVEAKMFPNENIVLYKPDPWSYLPEKQYLIFPHAIKYPLEKFPVGFTKSAVIELTKSDNTREYYGSGKIMYEKEGKYEFFFVGPKTMEQHMDGNSASFSFSEFNKNNIEDASFDVGGIEQTNALTQTNYVLSGFILGLIGPIMKFRRDISEGIIWLNDRYRQRNKRKILFGIGFVVAIVTSIVIVVLIIIIPENDYEFEKINSNTYVNTKFNFEIEKPEDWFFIKKFWINRERFDFSLPNYQVVGGVLVQRSINEKVSVLVFYSRTDNNLDLSDVIAKDLSYQIEKGNAKGKFIYTMVKPNKEFTIKGDFENNLGGLYGRIIKESNLIYLIYGETFSDSSNEMKQLIQKIVDDFKII